MTRNEVPRFYRAMHCSAKRGLAIACRLSVCLSAVTLVDHDHIDWKSSKLINTFALRSPKAIHLLPGEHGEILGRLEVGWEKWHAGAHKRQYL